MPELRIGKTMLQRAVIGEQKKALAVTIQPADRIDVGKRNILFQIVPSTRELAQYIVRFVEENVAESQITAYSKASTFSGGAECLCMCCERWRTAKIERQDRTCANIPSRFYAIAPTPTTFIPGGLRGYEIYDSKPQLNARYREIYCVYNPYDDCGDRPSTVSRSPDVTASFRLCQCQDRVARANPSQKHSNCN